MTPGKCAKSAGLTGLPEMAALSNKPKTTLSDWFRTNRELFNVVLSGCVNKKLNESINCESSIKSIKELDE